MEIQKKKIFIINILCKMAETPEKYSIMNNSDVKCKTPKKKHFIINIIILFNYQYFETFY